MNATLSRPLAFLSVACLALAAALPAPAAERVLRADRSRSFIDVDVKSTAKNFTAHLDTYDCRVTTDEAGKIKGAVLTFKFTDLRTGNPDRDADMIKWLGGGAPEGRFELGLLALAPDGQGQATGKLTIHDQTDRLEFSVNATRSDDTWTITGETSFEYTNWGLKVIKKAFLFKVDPEVHVRFKLTAFPPDTSSLVK
jgi:polyisoprenoid-binding protein YceI